MPWQGPDQEFGNLDAHLTNTCRLRPRPQPVASSDEEGTEELSELPDSSLAADEAGASAAPGVHRLACCARCSRAGSTFT